MDAGVVGAKHALNELCKPCFNLAAAIIYIVLYAELY